MMVLATLIVLGVLIFVHELGHFFAAKSVGIEVQRFSIGLGPRVFGFRRGETEYVLSAIPLGGYVKMGGMDDEVMERVEGGAAPEARTPTGREFDSKPLWARAFVISAGVIMNMLFAWGTYAAVYGVWGVPELRTTRIGEVVRATLPAGTEGLATLPVGARVVRVGDREVETWGEVSHALAEVPAGDADVVVRDPDTSVRIRIPEGEQERTAVIGSLRVWLDPTVGAVNPGSPAEKGDLRAADKILAVGGMPVVSWYDFVNRIQARPGERTELLIEREGGQVTRAVTPDSEDEVDAATGVTRAVGRIGIYPSIGELAYENVGAGEAVALGARETIGTTALILGFLKDFFTLSVSPRSVGSIITIGQASGQAAEEGMETFLRFIALFSVNLAVLNMLPIPVLDGGHLLFLAIEAVRRKPLSIEQRLRWSNVGLWIVMGIMVWALSNDVMRLFGL